MTQWCWRDLCHHKQRWHGYPRRVGARQPMDGPRPGEGTIWDLDHQRQRRRGVLPRTGWNEGALPWDRLSPDLPAGSTGASVQMWMSTLSAGQHIPTGTGAVSTGRITEVGSPMYPLDCGPGEQVRRPFSCSPSQTTRTSDYRPPRRAPVFTKAIQLASGGYIDCGVRHAQVRRCPHAGVLWRSLSPSTTIFAAGSGADAPGQQAEPQSSAGRPARTTPRAIPRSPWWPRASAEGSACGRRLGWVSVQWATTRSGPCRSRASRPGRLPRELRRPDHAWGLHHIMLSHDRAAGGC